jgi:hypothetical protein
VGERELEAEPIPETEMLAGVARFELRIEIFPEAGPLVCGRNQI